MTTTTFEAVWASGSRLIFRSITWAEYRIFEQLASRSRTDAYCRLYEKVVIEGPALDEAPAGLAMFLGRVLVEQSPFNGRDDTIKTALGIVRGRQNYLESARALVAGAFKYRFEEMDGWDADIFFDRLAKAERVLGFPLDVADPEKERAAREQAEDLSRLSPEQRQKVLEERAAIARKQQKKAERDRMLAPMMKRRKRYGD